MRTQTAIERARIAVEYYGVNLNTDYFSLDTEDCKLLWKLYHVTSFKGNNVMGRSRLRQFYYHLQWGWKKFQEQTKGAQ